MELRKKEFKFKGKTLEELKTLDIREFAKYLNSRQRRTVLRQFQKIEGFVNRAKEKIEKGKKVKTHLRDIVVVPEMVGMKIGIYNGQNFTQIEIIKEMLGHKFGEFSPTRNKVNHGSAGVGAT
ncbi:ribosomal protein S19 family protein, partial [Candidatus Pacearchaeota archaeon]|nr:ribosomal protein S19 family protein [Candidatus Pacearchaeota archaeon]